MKYSVIVPIHNEEDSILPLFSSLTNVMENLAKPYELIFVDDGSTDSSVERLKSVRSGSKNLRVICLREKHGMATALQAGFDTAKGDIFITLDGDLQNDPEDIPRLLKKIEEGYDVICGWRHDRKDPLSKRVTSRIANWIRRAVLQEKIHDVGCTLRVFKKEALRGIYLSGGLHRFLTAIMTKRGFRITEVPVMHHPRKSGVSKFGIWDRLVEGGADLIRIKFSDTRKLTERIAHYEIKEVF